MACAQLLRNAGCFAGAVAQRGDHMCILVKKSTQTKSFGEGFLLIGLFTAPINGR